LVGSRSGGLGNSVGLPHLTGLVDTHGKTSQRGERGGDDDWRRRVPRILLVLVSAIGWFGGLFLQGWGWCRADDGGSRTVSALMVSGGICLSGASLLSA
jgi:hypothetical protein